MADIGSSLSHDRTLLKIDITASDGDGAGSIVLRADDVEVLLLQLGRARSEMKPEVARKLDPSPVFRDVVRDVVFHVDRQHVVSKEFFIAARHPGFGWLAFTLNAENGLLLANLIVRQAEAIVPKIIKPNSGLIV